MGVEYRLRFAHTDGDVVASVLRRLPQLRALASPGAFELRLAGPSEGPPDASLQVEPCGVCFCWYGVAGREFLGTVIARLVSEFGPVTVEDWE
ncbi:hypothetical protein [Aquisphaera insulae]|uniref:hypothetical protein n=1 Tax=Aquisphaera insulae TaxID=2712864 RepID=UPI0013EC1BA3|nr:hypothetical protein [Aquisphaera insulae]